MKTSDTLKGLRISRAAVAKIFWNAIEAGADGETLRAIRDYIVDPQAMPTHEADNEIFEDAAAEADRAARRSLSARQAAARRRERRASAPHHADPHPSPAAIDPDPDPHGIKRMVAELNAPYDSIYMRRKWGLI